MTKHWLIGASISASLSSHFQVFYIGHLASLVIGIPVFEYSTHYVLHLLVACLRWIFNANEGDAEGRQPLTEFNYQCANLSSSCINQKVETTWLLFLVDLGFFQVAASKNVVGYARRLPYGYEPVNFTYYHFTPMTTPLSFFLEENIKQ